MDVNMTLVAWPDVGSGQSSGGALNHAALLAELLAGVDAAAGNARPDEAFALGVPAARLVLTLVCVQLVGRASWPVTLTSFNRWNGIE